LPESSETKGGVIPALFHEGKIMVIEEMGPRLHVLAETINLVLNGLVKPEDAEVKFVVAITGGDFITNCANSAEVLVVINDAIVRMNAKQ
jgi:hypothetical protein